MLKAQKKKKKVNKQTKNAPFYIHSGNESLKLVMLGNDLPSTIHHQPMITIIIIYMNKKENVLFYIGESSMIKKGKYKKIF